MLLINNEVKKKTDMILQVVFYLIGVPGASNLNVYIIKEIVYDICRTYFSCTLPLRQSSDL